MEEKPLILQYADTISQGKWRSFLETQPSATVIGELESLCHAALLSRNSGQAMEFLLALYEKTKSDKIQPEQYAMLSKTIKRAEAVAEAGGWQAIQNGQTEPESVEYFRRCWNGIWTVRRKMCKLIAL